MNGTILLLSTDPHLAVTRALVLESAGFGVVSVSAFEEAESMIRLQKPPMIILCQSLGSEAQARFTEKLQKAVDAPHVLSLQASLLDPMRLIAVCQELVRTPQGQHRVMVIS